MNVNAGPGGGGKLPDLLDNMLPVLVDNIRKRPLMVWCAGWIGGSAVAAVTGLRSPLALAGLAAAIPVLYVFAVSGRSRSSGWMLSLCTAFLLGLVVASLRFMVAATDVSYFAGPHRAELTGPVASECRVYPFGYSFRMDCDAFRCGDVDRAVTGRTIVWVSGSARRNDLPMPGQRVRVNGVVSPLGALDPARAEALRRQRVYCTLQAGKGEGPEILVNGTSSFRVESIRIRDWIEEGLRPNLGRREMAMISGMVFHQNDDISSGVKDDLQYTGTSHIIATAGLHVGVFLASCLLVFRFIMPRRIAVYLCLVLLPGYCIVCGGWPAALRATTAAEFCLLAWLFGRLPDIPTCLAAAMTLMTLLDPGAATDPGFQFTFLTVVVILLILPREEPEQSDPSIRWLKRGLKEAKEVVLLSLGAQLGSWPLTAFYFGIVSFIGIAANILVVPLLMLAIPLAFVTGIAAHVAAPLGAASGILLNAILHLMLVIVHRLSLVPLAWTVIDNVPWTAVCAYYTAVIGMAAFLKLSNGSR